MTQKTKLVTLFAAVAAIGIVWYAFQPKPEYGFTSVAFKKTGEIVQAYTPKNDVASTLGLGNRVVLPEDYGMLWQFGAPIKPPFTMKGMRFPLDFIWMKDGKIAEITPNVAIEKERVTPTVDITSVLEVNAGYAEKRGLKAGDDARIMDATWSGN
jgi:uncharacterized membrane protein (UPF0127 family)